MEKVCCGGFYLGEGLELDGRTLKATGGSSPVPDPEAADIGKVLGIVEDGTGAKYAPVDASGLPDPSTLTDGTVMVAVNGEWKMQEGYGYTGDPAFEPIEWDGDIEGRAHIDFDGEPMFYKISDLVLTLEEALNTKLEYTSDGEPIVLPTSWYAYGDYVTCSYLLSGRAGTVEDIVFPEDGTYCMNLFTEVEDIEKIIFSAIAPTVSFDPALVSIYEEIPVTFIFSEYGDIVADKDIQEIESALSTNKIVKGYLQDGAMGGHWITALNYAPMSNEFFHIAPVYDGSGLAFFSIKYNQENEKWESTSKTICSWTSDGNG